MKFWVLSLPVVLLFIGCAKVSMIVTPETGGNGIRAVSLGADVVAFKNGVLASYSGPFFTRMESQIAGALATTRTSAKRPVILMDADDDSAQRANLVKLEIEPKDSSRHVKFSSSRAAAIDPDWVIPVIRSKVDGKWALTPLSDLPRGEYAVWHPRGKVDPREGKGVFMGVAVVKEYEQFLAGVLYSFGVDD